MLYIYMDCLLERQQGCEYRGLQRQNGTVLGLTTAHIQTQTQRLEKLGRGIRKQIIFVKTVEDYSCVDGLDRSLTSARGRPRVATHAEGNSLCSGKADARAMLEEKRSCKTRRYPKKNGKTV